jgi:hypothetical protein
MVEIGGNKNTIFDVSSTDRAVVFEEGIYVPFSTKVHLGQSN